MKRRPLPSQEYLRECLSYNKNSGVMRWKRRPEKHFTTRKGWRIFISLFAGKPALISIKESGHLYGTIDGIAFLTHRIVWKLVSGKDPLNDVDHRDQNPANNRWNNLREATRSQNSVNRRVKSLGVYRHKNGRWRSYFSAAGKMQHIGYFSSKKVAFRAYREARKNYFGEFVS